MCGASVLLLSHTLDLCPLMLMPPSSRCDKDSCRQAMGRWWEALPGPEGRNQCETLAVPPRSFDSVLPGFS